MKQHTSKCLYDYWNELRGKNIAPKHGDLNPEDLENILPDLFMLDRISPNHYNFRLAGKRACNIFGAELTGHNFMELWNANDRDSFVSLLDTLTEHGAGIVCGLKGKSKDVTLTFEFLALPLMRNQTQLCSGVVGSFGFDSEIERSLKFPITDIEMVSLRVIWPIEEHVPFHETVARKNSVLQMAIANQTQIGSWARRPNFEVIQGGKL